MENRFTVWVGGIEVNDSYLTHEHAESLANSYIEEDYSDVKVQEMLGSIKASDFVEWFYSDEVDTKIAGEEVIHSIKTNGYYNMTVNRVFDNCEYIPAHLCEVFNIENVNIDEDYEFTPEQLIFIDDITHVGTCSKCHQSFSGDVDFCNNCGNCVS